MKKITVLALSALAALSLWAQPVNLLNDAQMSAMLGTPVAPADVKLTMKQYPVSLLSRCAAPSRAGLALTIDGYQGEALMTFSYYKMDDNNQLVADDPFHGGRVVTLEVLDDNTIGIYNLFGTDNTTCVRATMDFDSGDFTIAAGQTVYVSDTYGNCTMQCMQVKTSGTDITGTIYANGVVEFDDVWALVVQDGTYAGHYFVPMYACTYLELPNAVFEGTTLNGTVVTAPLAVYQYDDVVYVNNLAGFAMPSTLIDLDTINKTLTMSQQLIFDWFDNEESRGDDPQFTDYPVNLYLGNYYSYAATFADGALASLDGTSVSGTVYPDSLVLNPWAMYASADYYVGFVNSRITYTDGSHFCNADHGFQPGDVDHSGDLAINDVTILIDRVLAGQETPDTCCEICADVDGDGDIAINDVTALIDLVLAGGN